MNVAFLSQLNTRRGDVCTRLVNETSYCINTRANLRGLLRLSDQIYPLPSCQCQKPNRSCTLEGL